MCKVYNFCYMYIRETKIHIDTDIDIDILFHVT